LTLQALHQLDAVAEWVVYVEAAYAWYRLGIRGGNALSFQGSAQSSQVAHEEGRVGFAGRGKLLLDADMQLVRAEGEPHAAILLEYLRLLYLREAEEATIESTRLLFSFGSAWGGDLYVVKASDGHS